MGKARRAKKFAQVKRMINPNDKRVYYLITLVKEQIKKTRKLLLKRL